MQLRITTGTAVMRVAEILESAEEMHRMSTDGPFLVFDFAGLDHAGALAEISSMDAYIGIQAVEATDDDTAHAMTVLKRAVLGLERDLDREYMIRARISTAANIAAGTAANIATQGAMSTTPVTAEPIDENTGSHPTATGDVAISNVSQQSSEATQIEEIEVEQPQKSPRSRSSR